ncbi:MAG: fructose-6-phosphate aldolase [Thermales bacterium]|nr:fructose-6-phosphate aldolase [Thermales bacterium]
MLIYIDSANIEEISKYQSYGFIDGVTTNPSLIAKAGIKPKNLKNHLSKICEIVKGLVSIEVYATNYEPMLQEAIEYSMIAKNIVIKLPCTEGGLRACKTLSGKNIKTNITLVFSPLQAMMAAKMGATIVSPFIGRVEDALFDGIELITQCREIFDNYDFETKILSASFRSNKQIAQIARIGSDIATVSPELLDAFIKHPFTDIGLEKFLKDAKIH